MPHGKYLVRVSRQLMDMGEARFDVDGADVTNVVVHARPRR
jgi:hypothetical protein